VHNFWKNVSSYSRVTITAAVEVCSH